MGIVRLSWGSIWRKQNGNNHHQLKANSEKSDYFANSIQMFLSPV